MFMLERGWAKVESVSEHYFSTADAPDQKDLRLLHFPLRGHEMQMWVANKVFSAKGLDLGTKQLLEALPQGLPAENILDIGCGWGPISVVLGLEYPQAQVWAVDVNPRAVALTQLNAKTNAAENVRAGLSSEIMHELETRQIKLDLIVSNPPIRIGKAALHELLLTWLQLLAENGQAWFVVGKNLGADPLIAWLNQQGYSAQKVASKKGYRIIQVRR